MKTKTVGSALQAVLDDYELNENRSGKDAATRARTLLEFFDRERELATIEVSDLLSYAKARKATGRANATVNHELAILRRGFKLSGVPWVPGWKALRWATPRQGFFELDEFERVVAQLPPHYRGPVRFAYLTGWRMHSEVMKLRWRQVDFDKGEVWLLDGETKSGQGRLFPMFPALRALLEEQAAGRRGEYVFHRAGKPWQITHPVWDRACRDAKVEGRLMHDLRRTAARNLIKAGVDRQLAKTLLGHKTDSIFDRYRIIDDTDLRGAAGKLGVLLDSARKAG
jgi:integrase